MVSILGGCFELAKPVGWAVDTLTHFRNCLWNVPIIFQFYIHRGTLTLQVRDCFETLHWFCNIWGFFGISDGRERKLKF